MMRQWLRDVLLPKISSSHTDLEELQEVKETSKKLNFYLHVTITIQKLYLSTYKKIK